MEPLAYPLLSSQISNIIPKNKKPVYLLDEEIPKFGFRFNKDAIDDNRDKSAQELRAKFDNLPKRTFRENAFVIDDPRSTIRRMYNNLQYQVKSTVADFNGFNTQLFPEGKSGVDPWSNANDQSNIEYYEDLLVKVQEQLSYSRNEERMPSFKVPYVVKNAVIKESTEETHSTPFSCTDLTNVEFFQPKEFILFLITAIQKILRFKKEIFAVPLARQDTHVAKLIKDMDTYIAYLLKARKPVPLETNIARDYLDIYYLIGRMRHSKIASKLLLQKSYLDNKLDQCKSCPSYSDDDVNLLAQLAHFAESAHTLDSIKDSNLVTDTGSDLYTGLTTLKYLVETHAFMTYHFKRYVSRDLTYEDLDYIKLKKRLFDITYQPKPSVKIPENKGNTVFKNFDGNDEIRDNLKSWKLIVPSPLTSIDIISVLRLFDTDFVRFLSKDRDPFIGDDLPLWKLPDGTYRECDTPAAIISPNMTSHMHLKMLKSMKIRTGFAIQDPHDNKIVLKSLQRQVAHPHIRIIDASQLTPQYMIKRLFTKLQMLGTEDFVQEAKKSDDSLFLENFIKLEFIAAPKFVKDIDLKSRFSIEKVLDGMNDEMDVLNQKVFLSAVSLFQGSLMDYSMPNSHSAVQSYNDLNKPKDKDKDKNKERKPASASREQTIRNTVFKERSEILKDLFYKPLDCLPSTDYRRKRDTTTLDNESIIFADRIPKHHIFIIPCPAVDLSNFNQESSTILSSDDDYNAIADQFMCVQNILLNGLSSIATIVVDVCHNKLLIFSPSMSFAENDNALELIIMIMLQTGVRFRRSEHLGQVVSNLRKLEFSSFHFHRPSDVITTDVNKQKRLYQLWKTARHIRVDYQKNNILYCNGQQVVRGIRQIVPKPLPTYDEIDELNDDDRVAMGFSERGEEYKQQARRQRRDDQRDGQRDDRRQQNIGGQRLQKKNYSKRGGADDDLEIPLARQNERVAEEELRRRTNIQQKLDKLMKVNVESLMPMMNIWYAVNYVLTKQKAPEVPTKGVDIYGLNNVAPYKNNNRMTPDGFINGLYVSSEFQVNETDVFIANLQKTFEAIFRDFFKAPHRAQKPPSSELRDRPRGRDNPDQRQSDRL